MLQKSVFFISALFSRTAAALFVAAALLCGCSHSTQMYRIKLYSQGTFIREWKSPDGIIYRSSDNNFYFNTADNKLIRITSGELQIEEDRAPAQGSGAQKIY
jgi:hypothetical protein